MLKSLFSKNGIKGLADSLWSGVAGSVAKIVGIDYRTTPGIFKCHQKLVKHSPTETTNKVDELCLASVNFSDGSKLWFSSESGKIWREKDGDYQIVYTLNPDDFLTEIHEKYNPAFRTTFSGSAVNFNHFFMINPFSGEIPRFIDFAHNSETGGGDSISVEINIPNKPNMCAIVFAGHYEDDSGAKSITGAKIAGQSATQIATTNGSSGSYHIRLHSFRLTNLPIGDSIPVEIEYSENVTRRFVYVLIFQNVDQTTPVEITSPFGGFGSAGEATIDAGEKSTGVFANKDKQLLISFFSAEGEATHSHAFEQTIVASGSIGTVANESIAIRDFRIGSGKILSAEEFVISNNPELLKTYIYFATSDLLWRISANNIDSWDGNVELAGVFFYGDDEYHPMSKANLGLYVGDKHTIFRVDDVGGFTQTTFKVLAPERITALHPFDIDLLVGTKIRNSGRVLRWDTVAGSWGTEDNVEEDGINAFIKDDNYVYAQAGSYGRLYFYNGEKLELFKRIPGNWSPTSRAKVHAKSVGFHLGIPIFGLSSIEGNPQLLGIYGFGGYSSAYSKTLSLDFPIDDEFSNIDIGAIIVDGADLYVSYKHKTESEKVGIFKLDWNEKYNGYLETTVLSAGEDRALRKALTRAEVPHLPLPENTSINLSYKKAYEASFTSLSSTVDTERLKTYNRNTIPKVANAQVKVELVANGNDTPECEDLLVDLTTSDK